MALGREMLTLVNYLIAKVWVIILLQKVHIFVCYHSCLKKERMFINAFDGNSDEEEEKRGGKYDLEQALSSVSLS